MLDEMCAILGGRAAEELFTGRISTGAINDLERVTKQAYGMIAYAGMSENLPNLCYYNSQEQFQKPYSERTAELIDNEVKALIAQQYERAKDILLKKQDGHRQLADLLMEREVIFAEDAERIFGKRPWASRSEEILETEEENKEKTQSKSKKASESADDPSKNQSLGETPTIKEDKPVVTETPQNDESKKDAPQLSEAPDYSKAKSKSERPSKNKDGNLFGGFDFDQEDNR